LTEVLPSRRFEGVAGYHPDVIRAVEANHDARKHPLAVRISGLSSVERLAGEQTVRILAQSIPNSERNPSHEPLPIFGEYVPVASDAVRVTFPAIDAWGALTLQITADRRWRRRQSVPPTS